MSMTIRGQVGQQVLQDGSEQAIRLGKTGELVVTELHGKYYETSYRGGLFHATTAAAGVAPGTVLGAAPPMALWNPPGSGVNLVIVRAALGYISGTLGAGSVFWAAFIQGLIQNTVPTTGTELTGNIVPALIGTNRKPAARAFQGSTWASTPVALRPSFRLDASLATTASLPGSPAVDEIDGAFMVAPGYGICLQGVAAAGTSPLVAFGLTWEEVVA